MGLWSLQPFIPFHGSPSLVSGSRRRPGTFQVSLAILGDSGFVCPSELQLTPTTTHCRTWVFLLLPTSGLRQRDATRDGSVPVKTLDVRLDSVTSHPGGVPGSPTSVLRPTT